MKKSILISIKPEWVAKILNGEKTIEIRKTAPKCELPIEVYIYCTKSKDFLLDRDQNFFVWDKHEHHYLYEYEEEPKKHYFQGKVVAKFTLKRIDDIGKYAYAFKDGFFYETLKGACLTTGDLTKYASVTRFERKKLYAWSISDLEVFEEPKELSEFFSLPETYHHDHESMVDYYERKEARRLKRAPQSWQYVEVEE